MKRIITCTKHIALHEEHYLVANETNVNDITFSLQYVPEEKQERDDDDTHELYFQEIKTKFTAKTGEFQIL